MKNSVHQLTGLKIVGITKTTYSCIIETENEITKERENYEIFNYSIENKNIKLEFSRIEDEDKFKEIGVVKSLTQGVDLTTMKNYSIFIKIEFENGKNVDLLWETSSRDISNVSKKYKFEIIKSTHGDICNNRLVLSENKFNGERDESDKHNTDNDVYFYNRLIDNAIKNNSVLALLMDKKDPIPMEIFENRISEIIIHSGIKKSAGKVSDLKYTPYYRELLKALTTDYGFADGIDDAYMHRLLCENSDLPDNIKIFNKIIFNRCEFNKTKAPGRRYYYNFLSRIIDVQKFPFEAYKDNISNIIKAGCQPLELFELKSVDWNDDSFVINFIESSIAEGYYADIIIKGIKEKIIPDDSDNRDRLYKICEKSDVALRLFMNNIVFPLLFTYNNFDRMVGVNLEGLIDKQIIHHTLFDKLFNNEEFMKNYIGRFMERFHVPEDILQEYFSKICECLESGNMSKDPDKIYIEYCDLACAGKYVLMNQTLSEEFIKNNFNYFIEYDMLSVLTKYQVIPNDYIVLHINKFIDAGLRALLIKEQKCYALMNNIDPIEEIVEIENI